MARGGAAPLAHLIMVVGVLSVVWGVLTASFFGFNIAGLMGREQPLIAVDMDKAHLDFLMWLSITLGAVQLSAAHVWKAVRNFPGLAALSNLGWATFLWGMYGVLCVLLLGSPMLTVYYYLLVIGGSLAIVFAEPSRNPAKMLALGLANFPLAAIGTFGDTVSYVRLMAIGLGGSALAVTFNEMAATLPIYGTIPVLILGHALNVALSIVALLAHGVRLNMLEFSNNLGMQWSGASYEPFSTKRSQEN
jgi:V/A-type H+-transporting ATPase subunit I